MRARMLRQSPTDCAVRLFTAQPTATPNHKHATTYPRPVPLAPPPPPQRTTRSSIHPPRTPINPHSVPPRRDTQRIAASFVSGSLCAGSLWHTRHVAALTEARVCTLVTAVNEPLIHCKQLMHARPARDHVLVRPNPALTHDRRRRFFQSPLG